MSAPRADVRARALAAVLSANLLLLLGCAELNKLLGGPNANKTITTASPTGSPTPGALSNFTKNLGSEVKSSVKSEVKDTKQAIMGPIEKAIDDISPQDERALGQATSFHVISQNGELLRDRRLLIYVNEVGNLVAQPGKRMLSSSGKRRTDARRFFFGVVKNDELNAYAAPGGYIFVTSGLMQSLTCEADLAWVLGHEIAHVDAEHGLKALKFEAGARGSGVFGRPAEGATSFKDQDFFSSIVGKLAEFVSRGYFGSDDELAADADGLRYAIDAGYDAHGAERALAALATKTRTRKLLPGYKSPDARLGLLEEKIAAAPAGKLGTRRFDVEGIQRIEASLTAAAPEQVQDAASTP